VLEDGNEYNSMLRCSLADGIIGTPKKKFDFIDGRRQIKLIAGTDIPYFVIMPIKYGYFCENYYALVLDYLTFIV